MTRLRCLRQLRRGRLRLSVATFIAAVHILCVPLATSPEASAYARSELRRDRAEAAFGREGGQATGRVTGHVKLTLATSAPSAASAYERRAIGPRPKAQPELKSVVIFFTDLRSAKPATLHASIAQKDEQFAPHLVAVTAGSTVAFPNEDPFFHNVFSLSRGAAFNLGRYPSGSSRSKTFARAGIVKVFCEIHSHMSAVIRVFDHNWFSVPNDDGTFVIDNVPPGDHTLVAWHERIGERRDRVTIRSGAATVINVTLPVLGPEQ